MGWGKQIHSCLVDWGCEKKESLKLWEKNSGWCYNQAGLSEKRRKAGQEKEQSCVQEELGKTRCVVCISNIKPYVYVLSKMLYLSICCQNQLKLLTFFTRVIPDICALVIQELKTEMGKIHGQKFSTSFNFFCQRLMA